MIAVRGQKPFNSFFGKIACQLPNSNPKNMGVPLPDEPLGQPILQGETTF
jgi:hypothetical protein